MAQKEKSPFWDIAPLLSQKDLDGLTPEIFMVSSNRSAGKTTGVNRYAVNQYLKKGRIFGLEYRYGYELDDIPSKFFADIQGLFFSDYDMDMKKMGGSSANIYTELYLGHKGANDHKKCGYGLALNGADQIRRVSHKLADTGLLIMDEFQSENDHYCPKETIKFQSIHTSLARGQGKQSRYLPVIMMSNPVTLLNPYYDLFDVGARIVKNAKFIRGHGWVLEHSFNEAASKAQQESRFNIACSKSSYTTYASQACYLNDNQALIEKKSGHSTYAATLRYEGKLYALRIFDDGYYVDNNVDQSFKLIIAVTPEDVVDGAVYRPKGYISYLTEIFNGGKMSFKDLRCKEVMFKLLAKRV